MIQRYNREYFEVKVTALAQESKILKDKAMKRFEQIPEIQN